MRTELVGLLALAGCLSKPAPPGSCTDWGPFGAEVAADGANDATAADAAPWLSPDATELWFASDRPGANHLGQNIWHSQRPTTMDAWDAPVALDSDDVDQSEPFIDRDGLTLWFEHGLFGSTRLFTAHRDSPSSAFGPRTDAGLDAQGPAVSESGLVLVFADKGGPTTTNFGIWQATRSSPDLPFGQRVALADVDVAVVDNLSPSLGDHDRTLVFYRQLGQRSIIYAAARGEDGLYHDPVQLLAQDNLFSYGDPQLSYDGTTLAYARNGGGSFDVFYVKRECRN